MIDKKPDITAFISKNFKPGTLDDFSLKVHSSQLLEYLFDVFPRNCIDSYDLYDILTNLGYKPHKETKATLCWCLIDLEQPNTSLDVDGFDAARAEHS